MNLLHAMHFFPLAVNGSAIKEIKKYSTQYPTALLAFKKAFVRQPPFQLTNIAFDRYGLVAVWSVGGTNNVR